MRQLNIHRRSLGVTFLEDKQAQVVVWSPTASQVAIKVNDQSAALPLSRGELGHWRLTTRKIKPGDRYTFILDGEQEYPDPASLSQPEGVHEPSQAIDTDQFNWDDQEWVNPPLEDYLIYEIHTGTFTDEGTFEAFETKLDHLKALGVTAIEIMPVAQFADDHNWGYDGVYAYAVQTSYGGAAGLQRLINTCHKKGIAVILDVVYNHFGPEGNYLDKFGPYLTDTYCTPWGKAVNFDNTWCDGVRQYIIGNALMWLRDFHIDALRLDAVHAIKDSGPVHILQELRQEVDRLMEATGRRHYLMIECDLNDPRYINPIAENGYGMDAQWIDEFHHSLRVAVGEDKIGYYADFEGLDHLVKSYQDAYVYDGQFSEVRHRLFGTRAEHNPGKQFIVFSQNHDQVGNRKLGERSSQLYSFNTTKLMAGAVLVSPYIPLLFMGEEWGETNPFLYFANHLEPDLVEAVREGRKQEFAAFHSEGEVPDPQEEETFLRSKLQWELIEQQPHRTMLRFYQTLIALRQQLPALRQLDRKQMTVNACDSQQVLVLHRWYDDQHVLCLMNFDKEPQVLQLTAQPKNGRWQKLLDSADPQWQSSEEAQPSSAPEEWSGDVAVTVPAESLIIYAQGHEKNALKLPDLMA
ncbi:malto-oligosyltrehalose trehalohydrolase [Spirosoma oryzicola]|uniref:malto-oligosyltrehalose trehalohydrolase n=1 Tax=Spirosoma oryzicola TaxID=2898794 RepID=UPI001E4DC1C2|nr:malto-oligosyltrehalose trehalohydrolase [Spirosoma oryzicola]UHG92973.1 malto-oligosyltrehalose trehalohydrolase [Spirosoma oryzicola]